jgi:hypothetical protein
MFVPSKQNVEGIKRASPAGCVSQTGLDEGWRFRESTLQGMASPLLGSVFAISF